MEWINAAGDQYFPTNEGWYLVLFKSHSGEFFPLPLYYQFSWLVPKGMEGKIEYYTPIDNLPVELVSGGLW